MRIKVTLLMTFSGINLLKIGDGYNMEAIEQAWECLFSWLPHRSTVE